MFGSAGVAPPSCYCTAMVKPATCGRRSLQTLARDHTVVVPDLRGMGLSSKPPGGFTKMNQAVDVADVLDALKIERADVVAHDIGNMVAFAMAEKYPARAQPSWS